VKRFKIIDWLNIIMPMILGVMLCFQFSAWWLLLILAGLLYGSYMYRMSAMVEELKEMSDGFNDIVAGRTKSLNDVRARLRRESKQ
jgi:hypothetical protein